MTGATSPSGEPHPGEILNDDKIDGRTWTRRADEVPQTVAWVDVGGTWVAVVRIEITGAADARRMTKFGADGQMLESTVQVRPPTPPAGPTPVPMPVPIPTPTRD